MTRRASPGRGSMADARGVAPVAVPIARLRRPRAALLTATALQAGMLTVVLLARPARAQSVAPTVLPSGGQVIGGVASITRGGNTLSIDQSTTNAAINWQSFSVGSRATVGFHVPSAQATTINRVVGPDPSVIAGRITSNGNVVIANQSGIVFTHGAQVDVNSLVASAPGISAANAVAGKLVFDQPARPGAAVVNNGDITIRQAGLAALVGPTVANSGVISARLGRVVLGGAAAATVDFYGDGLLSFDVTKQVRPTANGGMALVTNTGTIVADGGTVTLSAAAVDGLVTNLVDAGGRISAPSVGSHTGSIVIDGTGGSVTVAGQLLARGKAAGTTGGAIEVNATNSVTVAPGAVVDASGRAGGGVVAVGTTLARARGGPAVVVAMAASVTVAQGATLDADALGNGNGGRVTVLSSGSTDFAGSITARGGPLGGDGGFAEISGLVLDLTGQVDVTAPLGTNGSILLDPGNLDIVGTGTNTVANGQTFTAASSVDPAAVEALSGNVTLSASGDITIDSALNFKGTSVGGFTLFAGGSIGVNAPVTGTGGIEFGSGLSSLGGSVGGITIDAPVTTTGTSAGANAIVLSAGSDGIHLNSRLGAAVVDLSATGGGVTQAGTAGITASLLQSGLGVAGGMNLQGTNAIGTLGSLAVTGGGLQLTDTGKLTLGGTVSVPTLDPIGLTVGGLVSGGGSLVAPGGTVAIAAFPPTDGLGVGAGGANTVSIDPAALAAITAGDLVLQGTGVNVARSANLAGIPVLDIEAGTGTITLSAGTLQADTLLANAAGGLTQNGGTLVATELTSSTGLKGGVTLDAATNTLATLGAIGTLTGDVRLIDVSALTVAGSLQAGNVVVNDRAAGTAITLNAGVSTPGTLSLSAPNGGITETASGVISAGTLLVPTAGGDVALGNSANAIQNVGNVLASGFGVTLTGSLDPQIAGLVSATSITVANSGTAGITVGGTLAADPAAGTLDLSTAGGGIHAASGRLIASTLTSSGGIAGTADLSGTANVIGTLSTLGVTGGDLRLRDTSPLTVAGTVTVGGGQTLEIADNIFAFAAGGSLFAPGGLVALGPTGNSGKVALASSAPNAIAPGDLSAITAGTLRLGRTDLATATAGSITAGGTVNATGVGTLDLETTGGAVVNQPLTLAAGGTFEGAVGSLHLGSATNAIPNLGSVDAGTGAISVNDSLALDVTGPVRGGVVMLSDEASGTAITLAGSLAGSTSVTLNALNGGVSSTASGVLATPLLTSVGTIGQGVTLGGLNSIASIGVLQAGAGDVVVQDTAALSLSGASVIAAPSGNVVLDDTATGPAISLRGSVQTAPGGTLDLSAPNGGIAQAGGTIVAGTLASGGGIGLGGLSLVAGSNTIGALGDVAVTSGGGLSLAVTGALSIDGVAQAGSVWVQAPGITLAGGTLAGSGAVTLDPLGLGVTEGAGGVISAGTLTLPSGPTGSVLLGNGNTIGVLGKVAAAGSTVDVSVGSGTLDVAGPVQASTATLADTAAGQALSLSGLVDVGGTLDLSSAGGIAQSGGTLIASTLVGSAAGNVSLGAGNTIATLGTFAVTGGSFALIDNQPLVVDGPLSASGIALDAKNAGGLLLAGSVDAGASGVLDVSSPGAVTQSAGTVRAGVVQSASGVASLNLALAGNSIAALGSLASAGGVDVLSAQSLAVLGSVSGTGIMLAAPTISVTGEASGTSLVSLDAIAGPLLLSGTVGSPGAIVDLTSAAGATQSGGAILASTLQSTGGLGGNVLLGASANSIGVLGALSLPGYVLTLADQAPLLIPASVSAASVAVTDNAAGTALNVMGTISGTVGVRLATPSGSALLSGSLLTPGTLDISGSAFTQLLGSGTIVAATLLSHAGLGDLTIQASSIDIIGAPLVSSGDVLINDIAPLTISGLVANTVAITDPAGMRVTGSLAGANGVTLVANAGPVAVAGTLDAGAGTLDVTAASGFGEGTGGAVRAMVLTSTGGIGGGGVSLGSVNNSIDAVTGLAAPGGIAIADVAPLVQSGMLSAATGNIVLTDSARAGVPMTLDGTLMGSAIALASTAAGIPGAAILQSSSSVLEGPAGATVVSAAAASGGVALAGTGNRISSVAGHATTGAFLVADTIPLALSSPIAAGGNLTITDSATGIAIAVDAPLTSGGVVSLTAGNGFAGANVPAIVLNGPIAAPAVALTSSTRGLTTAVIETAVGSITGNTALSARVASGGIDLAQTGNRIGTLGTIAAHGQNLSLVDGAPLTITGPLDVANFYLRETQPVVVTGDLTVANTWSLASTSTVQHVSGGLVAGRITGSATQLADFGSGDYVGTLGPFVMSGSTLALGDNLPLVIQGPIVAGYLAISAIGQVTIAGNIVTDGLPTSQQIGAAPSNPGSYISVSGPNAQIRQVGQTTVSPGNAPSATLRLQLPLTGGTVSLANLQGSALNLILGIQGGSATGNLNVAGLTVIGGVGSARLNGSVGSLTGTTAAQNSKIVPAQNGNYTLNNCPIESVSCVVLPVVLVIPSNPLNGLMLSVAPPQNNDFQILLPGIARKDY